MLLAREPLSQVKSLLPEVIEPDVPRSWMPDRVVLKVSTLLLSRV